MLKQVMDTDGRAPCPMCRKRISREAKLCPHCRTDLEKHPNWNQSAGSPARFLVVLIILATAAMFFFFSRH